VIVPATPTGSARWTDWYRRALPAYWLSLFCLTHLPKLEMPVRFRGGDKLAHVAAFGLLAFLFWRFAETLRRPLSARFAWIAGGCLAAYAAADEYLQQFVGRSADVVDWLCDLIAIGLVLAGLECCRRRHLNQRERFGRVR